MRWSGEELEASAFSVDVWRFGVEHLDLEVWLESRVPEDVGNDLQEVVLRRCVNDVSRASAGGVLGSCRFRAARRAELARFEVFRLLFRDGLWRGFGRAAANHVQSLTQRFRPR